MGNTHRQNPAAEVRRSARGAVLDLGTIDPKRLRIFMRNVDKSGPGGCWLWTASRDKDGYGRAVWQKIHLGAHRLSWLLLVGPIPDGLVIDHHCRVRHCVNPSHMQAVTQRTNTYLDPTPASINAAKTHCVRGHELSGDNLRVQARTINGRSYPMRVCKACRSVRAAA